MEQYVKGCSRKPLRRPSFIDDGSPPHHSLTGGIAETQAGRTCAFPSAPRTARRQWAQSVSRSRTRMVGVPGCCEPDIQSPSVASILAVSESAARMDVCFPDRSACSPNNLGAPCIGCACELGYCASHDSSGLNEEHVAGCRRWLHHAMPRSGARARIGL